MATENPLQRDLCAGTGEDGLVCNEMVVMAKEIYVVHYILLFFKKCSSFLISFLIILVFISYFPSLFLLAGKTSQLYISTFLLKIAISAIVLISKTSFMFWLCSIYLLAFNLYWGRILFLFHGHSSFSL